MMDEKQLDLMQASLAHFERIPLADTPEVIRLARLGLKREMTAELEMFEAITTRIGTDLQRLIELGEWAEKHGIAWLRKIRHNSVPGGHDQWMAGEALAALPKEEK